VSILKEAVLYKPVDNNAVICTACARYCRIPKNSIGFCGVRWNIDGKLQLMVYGKIITAHIDPIEKKPLVHYMPGSMVFSIATTGCNWACMYCQNYDISQRRIVEGFEASPEMIVKLAKGYGAHGLSYTYNEPTIFIEFAHDVGILARKEGLFSTFVTNGYHTPEADAMLSKFLDAATVDFKGNADVKFLRRYVTIPDPEPIFQSILEMKRYGIHIEITDLVVPEIGDDLNQARKLVRWIYDNLGPDVPIHFLRFHPDYKLMNIPWTPIETLEKHWKVAKEEGLRFAYIGNVPGHPLENTYCPECGTLLIRRYGFDILEWNLDNQNRCKKCGAKIPIIGQLNPSYDQDRFIYVPIHRYAKYSRTESIKIVKN
jgi:pyruvate formate lyase activating enzyme